MTQQPSSFNFPRAEAQKCVCCSKRLNSGLGFAVPHIGTVGPKCVHKYGVLAQALTQAEGLTVRREDAPSILGALSRLRGSLMALGYEARMVDNADGSKTLKIGALTRKHAKVCVTWEERRAEFERDLKLASARPAGQVAA